MKTATVIINGIQFPFDLVDHAISWAKKEGAQLNVLFLTSGGEMPEAYAFPSDIDLAEKIADTEDTEEDSAKILRSQGKVVRGMLKTEELSGNIEHLNDASLDKVLEKLKSSDLLFVDPNQGEIEMQGITRFKLQELVNKTSIQVEAA